MTTRTRAREVVASVFVASLLATSPAHAVADDLALERLTVIAIITGDTPRAMLVDPSARGWVVKRGDLVGRAEGGGAPCRWRVAEIHDPSVVFVRNEPQCAASPRTKTLTLTQ